MAWIGPGRPISPREGVLTMDVKKTQGFVDAMWDRDILPSLKEYITIPALSPDFDKEWEKSGHIDRAMGLIAEWCRARAIPGMKLEIVKLPGRSPLLFMEIPGKTSETVMLYGHMDKQPPVTGWREGLGPWTPVIEDGKLYGRGGADDGYAAYSALAAIEAVQAQGLPHARCVVLIEASEESGSPDLRLHRGSLKARIGVPSSSSAPLRRRQLRSALVDDVAPRSRRGAAHRPGAARGRALGGRGGCRSLQLPHRARASEPHRGRAHR
jgi:hypothetical protein